MTKGSTCKTTSGRFLALIGAHNSLGPEVPQLLSDFIRAMATVWTMATVATVTMWTRVPKSTRQSLAGYGLVLSEAKRVVLSRVHSSILLLYEAAGLPQDHFTRFCFIRDLYVRPRAARGS